MKDVTELSLGPPCKAGAVNKYFYTSSLDPREVVAIVSAPARGKAAGPSGWTFEVICAAYQLSDTARDVTLELVDLILSGELPRQAFQLDGLMIGLEKAGGGVWPIAVSETWHRIAGVYARCGHTAGASALAWPRCKWE